METALQAKFHKMEFKPRIMNMSERETPRDEAKIQAAIKEVMNRRTKR